jgi:glucose-1-phosphate cytidylyltransferase
VIKDFFINYQTRVSDFTVDFARNGEVTLTSRRPEIDWRVTLAETGLDTLTGSRVKRIEPYIGSDETFMLTYGDGVCDVDLPALIDFHRRLRPTVTVSGVRPPGRFGELEHDAEGRLLEFNEKPQTTAGRISGGFFVCERKLFDYLPPGRDDTVLESEPLKRLAREGQMAMFAHDGFWQCMDTFRDYELLNKMYEGGKAPWVTW